MLKRYPRQRIFNETYYFVTTHTKFFRKTFADHYLATVVREEIVKIGQDKMAEVVAYSLLPNHFHLLVETINNIAITKGLQLIKGRSARQINKLRKSRETVWETRFYSVIIFIFTVRYPIPFGADFSPR